VKLLLDEMLDREIAAQLRQRGHDVEAIQERPLLWGTPDEGVLADVAYPEQRILVTDNIQHFLPLHAAIVSRGDHHAGLLLVSSSKYPRAKRFIGRWVSALDSFLTTLPAGPELRDSYAWL
jgi:hypothetical protein